MAKAEGIDRDEEHRLLGLTRRNDPISDEDTRKLLRLSSKLEERRAEADVMTKELGAFEARRKEFMKNLAVEEDAARVRVSEKGEDVVRAQRALDWEKSKVPHELVAAVEQCEAEERKLDARLRDAKVRQAEAKNNLKAVSETRGVEKDQVKAAKDLLESASLRVQGVEEEAVKARGATARAHKVIREAFEAFRKKALAGSAK